MAPETGFRFDELELDTTVTDGEGGFLHVRGHDGISTQASCTQTGTHITRAYQVLRRLQRRMGNDADDHNIE